MKKSKTRLISILTISLVAIFTVICLVGFSACDIFTSSSSDDDDHVHTVTSWDSETEATCEEDGSQIGTCDICGDSVMVILPATGHDYVYEVIEEATCEEDGSQTGVCSICGDTVKKVIPATGHSWNEGEVTKEATEDEEGEMTYTCTVCGETKTETIPKIGSEENPDGDGDDRDDGDDEPAPDYSKVTDNEGEHARVAGSADADGRSVNLSGVAFDGSAVTATLSDDGTTWTLNGTSAKMDGDHANAFWVDETVAADHITHEYIVFSVYAGIGEIVTMTTSDGKIRTLSEATDECADIQNWIIDITDHDSSWCLTVTIADEDNNILCTYNVVLGDISSDYSYVTDVDGNYARVAGSADADSFFDNLNGVKFEDSSVNATLGEDGKTWTVSGISGTMTEEQAKAFWVDETIAANHVGHEYIVLTVYAGKGEVVTMTTSNGKTTEPLSGATSEYVFVQNWVIDVTDLDDSWYMLVTVSNDNGDTLYEYTVVLGEIQTYCELNGHSWDAGVVTEPTCAEGGYTTQTCSVCGATQEINEVAALGHDYAGTWDWSAQSGNEGYDVSATLTLVCSVCEDEQTIDSAEITPNSDGTYTAEVTTSDGADYTDTRRVFVEGSDGVLTDVGMGAEYTPQYSGDEVASYVLTKVSDATTNLVVAGYVNGLTVSVGKGGSSAATGRVCSASLETVVFEEGVTSINQYSFAFGSSDSPALKSVEFCSTITEIGKYGFARNSSLTSLEIPSTLTDIGDYSFHYSGLESIVIHGNETMTCICNYSFQYCDGLKTLTIDGGKVCLGSRAFYNCAALESVKIYGSIGQATGFSYAIGEKAFEGCTSLSTLIILGSAGVGYAGSNAFTNCPLDTVYFEGTESQWSSVKTCINYKGTFITASCNVYYYSEEYAENCWHWGEDGMPVMWDENEP